MAARKGFSPSILKPEDHSRTLFRLFCLFSLIGEADSPIFYVGVKERKNCHFNGW